MAYSLVISQGRRVEEPKKSIEGNKNRYEEPDLMGRPSSFASASFWMFISSDVSPLYDSSYLESSLVVHRVHNTVTLRLGLGFLTK